jgi:hypothetical protein
MTIICFKKHLYTKKLCEMILATRTWLNHSYNLVLGTPFSFFFGIKTKINQLLHCLVLLPLLPYPTTSSTTPTNGGCRTTPPLAATPSAGPS